MLLFAIAAFFVGLILFILWVNRRAARHPLTPILWIVYASYEALMHARVLCSGDCNIRIDILVIWPALLLLTIVHLVRVVSAKRQPE